MILRSSNQGGPDRRPLSLSEHANNTTEAADALPTKVSVDGEDVLVHGRRASDLAKNPEAYKPPQMVAPGIAAAGRVTMIAAREKLGKSTLAAYVAVEVSRGGQLWGEPVEPGLVLWIGLEEEQGDALRRFMDMGAQLDKVVMLDQLPGDGGFKQLKAEVLAFNPTLVIVDSLAAYAENIDDENGAPAWTRELKKIVALARRTKAAIVLLHHANKGTGAYRGSTAIGANMDMIIEMAESTRDSSARMLRTRGRWRLEPYEVRFDRATNAWDLVRSGLASTAGEPDEAEESDGGEQLKAAVLEWIEKNPGNPKVAIRKAMRRRAEIVDAALNALVSDGKIEHLGHTQGYAVAVQRDTSPAQTADRAA